VAARFVGAHVPTAKGLGNAIRRGQELGCTAVQVFTSSPRMWKAGPATPEKIADIKSAVRDTGIDQLVSHDTYLVNLCHIDPDLAEKSKTTLQEELERSAAYGIPYVVSHMGSLKGQDLAPGLLKVAEVTLEILSETPESVVLCMETTAGQGSAINSRFEELAMLLELCKAHPRLVVCLDTCHVFVAGYDIRTEEGYAQTMSQFDSLVGLDRLRVIHLNDSKKGLGSRVDRHDHIGKGEIGPDAFRFFLNDPRLESVPMVIETDTDDEGHEKDMATLHSLMQ
jgi:deoxyribonuclease-4